MLHSPLQTIPTPEKVISKLFTTCTNFSHRWFHSCVVLSGLDENTVFAKVQIYNQGKLQLTKEFTTILDPVLDGNGILILGQEQDSFGGGFDAFQSFQGRISQFNMYNR